MFMRVNSKCAHQVRPPPGNERLEGLCLIHSFGRLSFRALRSEVFEGLGKNSTLSPGQQNARSRPLSALPLTTGSRVQLDCLVSFSSF